MFKRIKKGVVIILSIALISYLMIDFNGPTSIALEDGTFSGIKCKKANNLSIQYIDESGDAWASRGMIIYRKKKKELLFEKIVHVPTGFSIFWFRNFSAIRWITRRPECIEFTVLKNGDISILSAGYMWHYNKEENQFHKSLKLDHYSKGNQGIFNNGLLQTKEGRLYFGEYFKNENDTSVSLYESIDNGRNWKVKYRFSSHKIRHIHSIQEDPYDNSLWLTTGDEGGNYIYRSDDHFSSLHLVGFGEKYFTTQLSFTKDDVYWGSDTESSDISGIYRWNRSTKQLNKILSFPTIFFYSNMLKKGTLVLSTTRENMKFEKDDITRLFIKTPNEKWSVIHSGTWKKNPLPYMFQRAKTRFPRVNHQSEELYMSTLKQTGSKENELVVLHEDDIIRKFK